MRSYNINLCGKNISIEIGLLAKQASGSCLVKFLDTYSLSTVCYKKSEGIKDFFPLMVLYFEKLYASGKIPGSFSRREGKPSDQETLIARLLDRPLRPLFPQNYYDEVQIVNTVMSYCDEAHPSVSSMLGSSISLLLSEIPFTTPVSLVYVGLINGNYILNPSKEEQEISDLNLCVAGTKDAIMMVEAGANNLSEEVVYKALEFGFEYIKELCLFQEKIVSEYNVKKIDVSERIIPEILKTYINDNIFISSIKDSLNITDNVLRKEKIQILKEEFISKFNSNFIQENNLEDIYSDFDILLKDVNYLFENVLHEEFRKKVILDKKRVDGRKLDEIRPLDSKVGILPRAHGSSLFTRGQTQSLGSVTLGSLNDFKLIDGLDPISEKRFLLHYNFPAFSVGETGRYGPPGRREVGHGALAERALSYVIPSEDIFPYTIRVVSEILESNGSSSQATVCSATLALMDAGVPIKEPIAGIAMGLLKEEDNYTILTDIQGLEDHLGDMDFKVAGSKNGITALQMDIKIKGISFEIINEALEHARVARLKILDNMLSTIEKPRELVSKFAPKFSIGFINPAKIKDVIGTGGKIIDGIIKKFDDVKIDITDEGKVIVMHLDINTSKECLNYILKLVEEVEVGKLYEAVVTKIEKFGLICEVLPNTLILCHISKLNLKKDQSVNDFKIGDKIIVRCIEIRPDGRVELVREVD